MRFLVLGPLRAVGDDGADATPRGQRALDLLAALVLRRRQPVDPQVLLELVWGDEAVDLDVSAVHTVVARLRRTLGGSAVETTPRGYRLAESTSVDADEFAACVARARQVTESAAAIAAYDEALAMWRPGTAYDGASDELVAADRSRLIALRDLVREALTEALLDTGERAHAERALQTASELVDTDPLRERAHELLMTAQVRLGRQADALATYRSLQELLRDELGIDPGPQVAALHARVLAQDRELLGVAMPRPGERRRSAPPAPLTPLVGRDDELAVLTEALAHRRLVTITGPGGVGKSRLLAEAYHRAAPDDDLGYVDLAIGDELQPSDLCDAVAAAFAVRLPSGLSPLDALAEALGGRSAALFLDEAERAQETTAAVVGGLLPRCPGLRVCVTSRRALDLSGQRNLELGPLTCPEPHMPPEQARDTPAVRLLLDRLLDRSPGLELDPEGITLLGRLARQVDGLPLALELLARQASIRSLAELDVAAARPLDLTGEQDRPERH
ncbi:MAG: winged helix-turn-helix domain-containing protein, partial [Nocardioidaceae bacterium]|nr:winged helix-turn-helix domain-containing protein [Nocardioidaceae bacterium]